MCVQSDAPNHNTLPCANTHEYSERLFLCAVALCSKFSSLCFCAVCSVFVLFPHGPAFGTRQHLRRHRLWSWSSLFSLVKHTHMSTGGWPGTVRGWSERGWKRRWWRGPVPRQARVSNRQVKASKRRANARETAAAQRAQGPQQQQQQRQRQRQK